MIELKSTENIITNIKKMTSVRVYTNNQIYEDIANINGVLIDIKGEKLVDDVTVDEGLYLDDSNIIQITKNTTFNSFIEIFVGEHIIIDLETTGFNPKSAGVTEISCILTNKTHQNSKILLDTLTDPHYKIPNVIVDLTGITNKMVDGKPPWKQQLRNVALTAIKYNLTIIAHNTDFERTFFIPVLKPNEFDKIIGGDSAAEYVSKHKDDFPSGRRTKGGKLQTLCDGLGIEFDSTKAHRAMYDVIKTQDLLAKLYELYGESTTIFENYKEFSNKY